MNMAGDAVSTPSKNGDDSKSVTIPTFKVRPNIVERLVSTDTLNVV